MTPVVPDKEAQRKSIGEFLRTADKFIKSSEFTKALDEVNKALEIEPKNMYALAYNERIKVAIDAARKKEEADKAMKVAEPAKPPAAPAPSPSPSAPPKAAPPPEPPRSGDDMIARIRKEAQEAADKRIEARVEEVKREYAASQAKLQQDVATLAVQAKEALAAREAAEKRGAGVTIPPDLFRKLFGIALKSGTISEESRAMIEMLRDALPISAEEYAKQEKEAKGAAYFAHLMEAWKDGNVTPEEAESLDQLRKTLNISAEDHLRMESELRKQLAARK